MCALIRVGARGRCLLRLLLGSGAGTLTVAATGAAGAVCVVVLPEDGHADVSFWCAMSCVVGVALLLLCALYYYVWIVLLPKIGRYGIGEEVVWSWVAAPSHHDWCASTKRDRL
ncbi:hypothetical protein BJV78DRAFT_1350662, partial [Lactifluus subvellereus]